MLALLDRIASACASLALPRLVRGKPAPGTITSATMQRPCLGGESCGGMFVKGETYEIVLLWVWLGVAAATDNSHSMQCPSVVEIPLVTV